MICVQHSLRIKGLWNWHCPCMQPATVLQMVLASAQHCIVCPNVPMCGSEWEGPNESSQTRPCSLLKAGKYVGSHGGPLQSPRQDNAIKNISPPSLQQRWNDFTCYASPSLSQRRQWRQQCAEAKNSNIWGSITFLWTLNKECRKRW